MAGNRMFDDLSRLVTDATGMAQGVRREVETAVKSQIERILRDMDVATREEVDVLRDLLGALRAENDTLKRRLDALEGKPAEPSTAYASAASSAGATDIADRGPDVG